MKKKIVSTIMLTLLIISILTFIFNIQPVRASGSIYIRADGSVDPDTAPISSVDNTTYTFTDNIFDEVIVERDNIVIDGAGCTVQGTGEGKGIDLSYKRNVTVKTMKILAFRHGIYLYESSSNTISENIITNHIQGVWLQDSVNNTISRNNIGTIWSEGIVLWENSEFNKISENARARRFQVSYYWKDILSKLVCLGTKSLLLLLIIPCFVSLKGNSQEATSANAVSSNSECEEEIELICRGMGSLQVLFRLTNAIRLPINISNFAAEPSFISATIGGSAPGAWGWPQNYSYVNVFVRLNTEYLSVSEGKSKSGVLMEEFTESLHITLLYDGNQTWKGETTYLYEAENPSHAIQKLREWFLEHKPSIGFGKIITPTLLEDRWHVSIRLEREAGDLKWKAEAHTIIPDYIREEWLGWFGKEYSISLKEWTDFSGYISSSPNSTKSTLRISFDIPVAFLQIFPYEEVRCLEIVPSQMNVSRRGEVFEKDITGNSVEDLYIRFKWAVPWWSLIGVTVLMLAVVALIIIFGISPLVKFAKKIPGAVWGFLFVVGLLLGAMSLSLIILNIVFLFNPSIAYNQYGWTGFGVWLGIWIAIAVEAVFPLARELKKRKEKRKELQEK